jgi:hypothetical protein
MFFIHKLYTAFYTEKVEAQMTFKGLFGGNKKAEIAPLASRISAAPGQSDEERDATRAKMQAEMDAQRAARDARKTVEGSPET